MNAIEVKNLHKSYKDFELANVSFTLPSGCILGLIGENGAGKSTTIKLILEMIKKDGGTVSLFGSEGCLESKKEDIGVVLDEVGIPACLNAKEVGRIMRGIYKNWDSALFADYIKRFKIPEKKAFKDYSKGMKMKLGIAVALSHKAKLLILDEATSGLDPVVRDEILDIFNEFTRNEEHSVLISSHIVSDLEKICDYIAFIHNGRLILFEEKDRLLEEYSLIHCTEPELASIPHSEIIGTKRGLYGIEAMVKNSAIPVGMPHSPIDIEQLFIFMAKEEK